MNIRRLINGDAEQVLAFLNCKPLENLIAIGLIRANGLESPENRGVFYGYFEDGCLTGVTLVGRVALLTGSREAVAAFAEVATSNHASEVRRVLGKEAAVREFDRKFNQGEFLCESSDHLFWVNRFQGDFAGLPFLEICRPGDFEELSVAHMDAHAEILGSVPSGRHLAELRDRLQSRVEAGRVFVTRDSQGIAFKADIVSDSEEGVYLEAVWTRPNLRGNGYAKSAMRALCKELLNKYHAVCLFADAQNKRAMAFYRDTGFEPLSRFCVLQYQPGE